MVLRQGIMFPVGMRGCAAVGKAGMWPALVRRTTVKSGARPPLANAHSMRDSCFYRASFTRPDRPEIALPETRS